MRLIDADEFVKRVIQYPRQSTKTIGLALADTPTADVVEKERYDRLLENATIMAEALRKYQTDDMVEVVRCKDCIYYNAGFECLKEGYGIEYPPDYYCADGKRKETEDGDC